MASCNKLLTSFKRVSVLFCTLLFSGRNTTHLKIDDSFLSFLIYDSKTWVLLTHVLTNNFIITSPFCCANVIDVFSKLRHL